MAPTDRHVRDRLESAVAALSAAGATVIDEVRPPTPLEEQHLVYLNLLSAVIGAGYPPDVLAFVDELAAGLGADDDSRPAAMLRGMSQGHRDWHRANEARHRMAHQ